MNKNNLPYELSVTRTRQVDGVPVHSVKITDKYSAKRYSVERRLFRGTVDLFEYYLRRYPGVSFQHKLNLARAIIYTMPSIKIWATYMPGGVATHFVHNPEHKRFPNKKRIDPLTRRMFRHAYDAVAIRSRAYILSWWVREYLQDYNVKKSDELNWLSIAAGSGQYTYDVVETLGDEQRESMNLTLLDIDNTMLEFAEDTYRSRELSLKSVDFKVLDVNKKSEFDKLLTSKKPLIIDAMGLFEYLNNEQSVGLVKRIYEKMPENGIFIFTNMSPEHPHLQTHKRALGWPGVIQRSQTEVREILKKAGIKKPKIQIAQALDKVYNVYRIEK